MTETNAQLVMRVGDVLYGATAVDRLAASLPMAKRTVERIAGAARDGGDYPAAAKALNELHRLIDLHRAKLDGLDQAVSAAITRAHPQGGYD